METNFVKCPNCDGDGYVRDGVHVIPGEDEYPVWKACLRCNSTGKLPEHDPELLLERIKKLEAALAKR